MTRRIILFFSILALLSSCKTEISEIPTSQLPLADPFILLHEGTYYAYGTGEPGFRISTSQDLRHWKQGGIALDLDKVWVRNNSGLRKSTTWNLKVVSSSSIPRKSTSAWPLQTIRKDLSSRMK